LRSAEAAVLVALAAFAALESSGAAPAAPAIHQAGLESGLVIDVVAAPEGADASKVAALLVLPVGWSDDSAKSGSGLASLMADYAVHVKEGAPVWSAHLEPCSTSFEASLTVDQLESELGKLAKRLSSGSVEGTEINELVQARKTSDPTSADRFRETAFPQSREGGRPSGRLELVKSTTREQFESFLAARVGSEGAVLVLVGSEPASKLELAASRALQSLPRARGVAPHATLEPLPTRARRVAAPGHDATALVGFRLAWRHDPHGDGAAFAAAWLEEVAQRDAALHESSACGPLVAFAARDAADAKSLHDVAAAAADELAKGRGLSQHGFEAALARLDARLAEAGRDAAALARLVGAAEVELHDPLAPFERRARLERAGLEALSEDLAARVRPEGMIDVVGAESSGGS
jgi:predicted Zn-dependent peptidase